MEQTKVTYRGRELFTLGHFGTFINYILIFLFGVGWLSAGVCLIIFSKGDSLIFPIIACVLGVGIMFVAFIAMYDNRKEVIDKHKYDKDVKLIGDRLAELKSSYKNEGKCVHHIIEDKEEGDVIVDNFVWDLFEKLLTETSSFSNNQITLLTKIYDGLGIDSYYFLLENGMIQDRFLRGQEVVVIKDTPFVKAGTRMIVKMRFDAPSFVQGKGDNYMCEIIDTKKRVFVYEIEIKAID